MKTTDKNKTVFPQVVEIPKPLEIHPSVSPLAAELLERVIEILMVTPEKYGQGNPHHSCGSPCCIIGHMGALAGVEPRLLSTHHKPEDYHLTRPQFDAIYWTKYWPTQHGYNAATPQQGIARIEHFLSTGE